MPREACLSILHMLFCPAFVRKPYLSISPGFTHPSRSFPELTQNSLVLSPPPPVAPSFSGLQHGSGLITIFPSPWQRSPCILTMIWTDLNLGVEGCQPGHETDKVGATQPLPLLQHANQSKHTLIPCSVCPCLPVCLGE